MDKDEIVIDGATYRKVESYGERSLLKRIEDIDGIDYTRPGTDDDGDPITHVEFLNGAELKFAIDHADSDVTIHIKGWSFGAESLGGLIEALELIKGEIE